MTCATEDIRKLQEIAAELNLEQGEDESSAELLDRMLEELDDRFEQIEDIFERIMDLDVSRPDEAHEEA